MDITDFSIKKVCNCCQQEKIKFKEFEHVKKKG